MGSHVNYEIGVRVVWIVSCEITASCYGRSQASGPLYWGYYHTLALDVKWHWYQYEYQARGSTHAHGSAKLLKMIVR